MNYIASYPKPGEKNECKSYNHITTYTKTRKQTGKEKKAKTRQEIERGYGVNKDRVLEGSII